MAEHDVADRHRDRAAGVDDLHAAREAVGRVHGDRAHAVVAEVLLHLADEDPLVAAAVDGDRVVDLGKLAGEDGLDDDALDLFDPADVAGLGVSGRSHKFSLDERLGARDDFHDLLRDVCLTLSVGLESEVVDQLGCVV